MINEDVLRVFRTRDSDTAYVVTPQNIYKASVRAEFGDFPDQEVVLYCVSGWGEEKGMGGVWGRVLSYNYLYRHIRAYIKAKDYFEDSAQKSLDLL